MVSVHQRIAEVVVLVRELDGRLVEHDTFLNAEALGEGTGGNVADDDLERHDGDLLDQILALGELLDEMRRHALLLQQLEHMVAHDVVNDALAGDRALLEAVECGRVVLVVYDDQIRVVGREYLLGLAFVQLFFLFHVQFLHFNICVLI